MEFQNLGKNCSEPTCRQIDFLPVTCKLCTKVFCLDHQNPSAHHCPEADLGDRKAIICPVCHKTLQFEVGKGSEEEAWNRHVLTGCKGSNLQKGSPEKGNVCAAKGCKTKLTSVNEYQCKKCSKKVCLKHRFEEDHECIQAVPSAQKPKENKPKEIKNERPIVSLEGGEQKKKEKKGFFGKVASALACNGCSSKKKKAKNRT